MNKKVILASLITLAASGAFGQAHPAIEKAFADPARKANEAKADVYIHKKRIVADTATSPPSRAQAASQKGRNKKSTS